MKLITPEFYDRFRCTASRCRHNCCIGWEIDIDTDTFELYRNTKNSLSDRFCTCISSEAQPHFILGENERCPFLNKDNLCDIILEMGEDSLCQICSDHPRFRNLFSSRTEAGVGLCCEEACRLLLENEAPLSLHESVIDGEETDDEYEEQIFSLRDRVFSLLQDRSRTLCERTDNMLSMFGAQLPDRSIGQWAEVYLSLEQLDPEWTALLGELKDAAVENTVAEREYEYEQFIVYWLFRHFGEAVYDGDVISKIRLAVLSLRMIRAIDALYAAKHGPITKEQRAEHMRMYSAEIEYSQENLDTLYDILCD